MMLREQINKYKEFVGDFANGITDSVEFKKHSSPMGVYEQKESNTFMVRVRIPAGSISLDNLKNITNLADLHANGYIHFTTRQDIQFHDVNIQNITDIIEGLYDVNLITYGSGGNAARNVACSPLSGVDPDEIFDVSEYALKSSEYFLKDASFFNLPRKYKVSFSNSPSDTANATISDLGFVAKIENGNKGFEVYGAGGLGNSSCIAVKLADFIPACEVLYYIEAMKRLLEAEGDRTNRNKARIRFIMFRLGEDEFRSRYLEFVDKVKAEKDSTLNIAECSDEKYVINNVQSENKLLIRQKNNNYSVYVHPLLGNITTKNLNKIISFIEDLDYSVSIFLTNTQGFMVRDLKFSNAEKLLLIISKFTSVFNIDNSVTCVGSSVCKIGICKSQDLLSAIIERFSSAESKIKLALPVLFISGCKNSCGQHQKGEIGFSGKFIKTDQGIKEAYTVFLGGNIVAGNAKLGEAYGDVIATDIPEFLLELAKFKSNYDYKNFNEFLSAKKEATILLVNKYVN